jgi:hypothetical protein
MATKEPAMIDPNAVALFDTALRDAGIPIYGVVLLSETGMVDPSWPDEWQFVVRPDGLIVRIDYTSEATESQIQQGNAIVMTLDVTLKQSRPLWAIYTDIVALSIVSQDRIRADMATDSYAKVRALRPPQDGPALALHWAVVSLQGATQAEKRDAMMRMASMISQQNPQYLVNPPFDETISIPGDEPVP